MTPNACSGCRSESLTFDFAMAFQPIVDLRTSRVWGYEALVRGAAGKSASTVLARVNDENRYRFDQACRVKAIEAAARLFPEPDLHLSINFLPNAVYEPAACIRASLAAARRAGFARDRIMFEFTENEQVVDSAKIIRIVEAYRQFGFITAIDDFGAGYAGLGRLASLTPDLVKIDMGLIRGVDASRSRQAIIAGIVAICRDLGIRVLGEGVETAAELAFLVSQGVGLAQGYYFARPETDRLPAIAPLAFSAPELVA